MLVVKLDVGLKDLVEETYRVNLKLTPLTLLTLLLLLLLLSLLLFCNVHVWMYTLMLRSRVEDKLTCSAAAAVVVHAVNMSDVKLDVELKDLDEDAYRVNLKDITCSFTSEDFRKVAIKEAVDGERQMTCYSILSVTAIKTSDTWSALT
jgi:uncharacterized protein (DUF58 family)